ncbi:MAG: S-layer homology domain-containing protein [Clostridiales bacterium]|nr:S-layer homology domain-containing protein [Clostridiales bacterium]
MKKKMIAFLIIAVGLFASVINPVTIGRASAKTYSAQQLMKSLGIMRTDKGYLSNEAENVSRSQFAQLLVNASTYKEKISRETNVSLYSDVPKEHWAAAYIQTAISNGWMSGYLDGSFRPDKGVTLQEAVKGVITLLGYTSRDFSGNIIGGQMTLYQSKGLDKNIRKTRTQYLTVKDCNNLFYNLLSATTKEGVVYAQTLGYTIDSNGNVDYLSIVNNDVEGPIIADDNWKSEIPFPLSRATIYLDETKAYLNDINDYDVIYYSSDLETVWAYDNKVTGTLEKVSPNRLNPQSVTVAGKEYTFETSIASVEFSTLGNVKEGDLVTLLLGKNDEVASVIDTYDYDTAIAGIALESGTHLVEDPDRGLYSTEYVVFVDAAGNEHKIDYDDTFFSIYKGDLVRVSYEDGVASVNVLENHNTDFGDYKFSMDGNSLGGVALASNVKIIDYNDGNYTRIYPSRLGNVRINSAMILYAEKNERGAISQLILDNVTGDTYDYGILTGFTYPMGAKSNNYIYEFLIDGKSGSVTGDIVSDYNTEIGPKGFLIRDNELIAIKGLTEVTVQSIGSTYVQDTKTKYLLAEDCAVYFYKDGIYTKTTIDKVTDLMKFKMSAYYDKEEAYGGRVRVIIVENKN